MNSRLHYAAFSAVLLALSAVLHAAAPTPAPGSSAKSGQPARGRSSGGGKVDYILQPEDQLRVFVFQHDDINKQGEVSISQEHTITLPLIQTISLKGLTARQAEELIRQLYDKDYLVNPQVTVTVQKYSERSVNILGSVKKAGKVLFPPEGGMTLLDAIAGAEGHDRFATLKSVQLTRKNEKGEQVSEVIDVSAILDSKREDIPLQPGDQIFIRERVL